MIDSLEVVIAASDVTYLAAVLRGEFDAKAATQRLEHGREPSFEPTRVSSSFRLGSANWPT